MDKGWISLSRKIQDCFIWDDKPFARGQAWIDMLLLANHSDKEFMLGNEIITVERGSFITSEVKLSERWGWGRKKTRLFLELLESQQMISKKANNKRTAITIVNYSNFQTLETKKEQQKNSRGTSKEQQRNTNNNDNNVNNVINKDKGVYFDSQMLNSSVLDFIEMRRKTKSPMTDRAIKILVSKINEMLKSYSEEVVISSINESIMSNWKSIYPPKRNKKKPFSNFDGRNTDIDDLEKQLLGL
ncbi:hypothetical protein ACTQ6A_13815 [Lachnospiraceae bacterium LCP25S3_G4]